MRFYNYDLEKAPQLVMLIDAELQNLDAEREVLEAVAEFKYSGNVFNKRYETQLHKYLGDKFGRIQLDEPNYRGETAYNKINVFMHEESSYDGEKRYSLKVSYKGYERGYDYDTKEHKIVEKNQMYQFYSVHNPEEVSEQATQRLTGIDNSEATLKANRSKVVALIKEHNAIREKLEAFNAKIPYILSNELRIG